MALTTYDKVKKFKNITDGKHDEELKRLVVTVQAFLENACNRSFDANAALVEYHSTAAGQTVLFLDRPPIASIASIYDDPDRAYGAATLIAATDYVLADAAAGIVRLDGVSFQQGINNVKVTYSGGNFSAGDLDVLEQYAIELIWLARMKGDENLLGLSAKSVGDGNISLLRNDWPAGLGDLIGKYRLEHKI